METSGRESNHPVSASVREWAYWAEHDHTVLHTDALTFRVPTGHMSVMITDPPYSEHVHKSATSQSARGGTRKRDLGFEHLADPLRARIATFAAAMPRWSVVYSDVESSAALRATVESQRLEYVRTMPWVRWSMPQLSGDRPPQGFEHLLVFHPRGRKRWNGPGNLTHFAHLALRGALKHKCEKPLDQALDLVSYFSEPGERVFDPFSGSGAIGLACRLLGRRYLGLELDAAWAARSNERLVAPLSSRDVERCQRWLAQPTEPDSALKSGPSIRRAMARLVDRNTVAAALEVAS